MVNNKEGEQNQEEILKEIQRVIIVLSGKGGVGKSTVSVNVAGALWKKGYRVGLLDIDIHGPNVPKLLGLDGKKLNIVENMLFPVRFSDRFEVVSIGFLLPDEAQAVAWRGPMKHKVISEFLSNVNWGPLDVLVIDSPPGTGDEILSIYSLLQKKLNGALIVTTPQKVAMPDVKKSITFCQHTDIKIIGLVENMSSFICPKCKEKIALFKEGRGEELAKSLGIPFLGSIPLSPEIIQAEEAGRPVVLEFPEGEVAREFDKIAQEIIDFLGI